MLLFVVKKRQSPFYFSPAAPVCGTLFFVIFSNGFVFDGKPLYFLFGPASFGAGPLGCFHVRPAFITLAVNYYRDLSDFQLNSALGRFDGRAYEALLETTEVREREGTSTILVFLSANQSIKCFFWRACSTSSTTDAHASIPFCPSRLVSWLLTMSQRNPLNARDPVEGYEEHLEPVIRGAREARLAAETAAGAGGPSPRAKL